MPRTEIIEKDLTSAGNPETENFTVLIAGVCGTAKQNTQTQTTSASTTPAAQTVSDTPDVSNTSGVFDSNNVVLLTSQSDFITYIGKAAATEVVLQKKTEKTEKTDALPEIKSKSYGNQIAYELLGLGYNVLFKKIDPSNDELSADTFWEPLKDRGAYDFRYIVSGILENNDAVNKAIAKLASHASEGADGRGDCTALLDIDQKVYEDTTLSEKDAIMAIAKNANSISNADKFSTFFAPNMYFNIVKDKNFGNNDLFPGSFYYLASAMYARNINFAEHYAVAGYTRGINNYSVAKPVRKFGENAQNALSPRVPTILGTITGDNEPTSVNRAVNLIISIRNNYYLWGNRTAELLTVNGLKAAHFLNIRQLCTTINKKMYDVSRSLTFDPNSDILWTNFCNKVRPVLNKAKSDQGLENFMFVKLANNQKAELRGKIRIVPIEAVEDFTLGISMEDSIADIVEE